MRPLHIALATFCAALSVAGFVAAAALADGGTTSTTTTSTTSGGQAPIPPDGTTYYFRLHATTDTKRACTPTGKRTCQVPVKGVHIVLYRGKRVFAKATTNTNGLTRVITLYPEGYYKLRINPITVRGHHFRASHFGLNSPMQDASYPKASIFPFYFCTRNCAGYTQ
jgi:hypothetical protein